MKAFFILLRELFRSFFILPKIREEEILKPGKETMKSGVKVQLFTLVDSLLITAFAFLLKLSNSAITNQLLLLGLILFMLYQMQPVFNDFERRYEMSLKAKHDLNLDNSLCINGGKIVSVTAGKVQKWYPEFGVYKTMSNEEVMYSTKKYLEGYWYLIINYIFNLLSGVIAIVMAILAITTNDGIENSLLVISVVVGTILAFLTSAYRCFYRLEYSKGIKGSANKQSLITGDLLRVPPIVKNDLQMRLKNLEDAMADTNQKTLDYSKGRNNTDVLMSLVRCAISIAVIISYVSRIGLENLSLVDITKISAILAIMHTLIKKISDIPYIMEQRHRYFTDCVVEKNDFEEIMKVYTNEVESSKKVKPINEIFLSPFKIKYKEESENDKAFTLISDENIHFKLGDVVMLYGASGSGKSTFINLLTDRIVLEKSVDLPNTSRALIYDEKLRFGSMTLYEELFCCEENPNLEKMKDILMNLHLWQELQTNCKDVWQWMKEKYFRSSLSNGQKQRLIIAKILYFLDDTIDVLALDECTSGLDDVAREGEENADAERVLKYIVDYASKDRERIIVIATHQNVESFVIGAKKMHNVHSFKFERGESENHVMRM